MLTRSNRRDRQTLLRVLPVRAVPVRAVPVRAWLSPLTGTNVVAPLFAEHSVFTVNPLDIPNSLKGRKVTLPESKQQ